MLNTSSHPERRRREDGEKRKKRSKSSGRKCYSISRYRDIVGSLLRDLVGREEGSRRKRFIGGAR